MWRNASPAPNHWLAVRTVGHEEQPRRDRRGDHADDALRRASRPREHGGRLRGGLRRPGALRPGEGRDRDEARGPLAERRRAGAGERGVRPGPRGARAVALDRWRGAATLRRRGGSMLEVVAMLSRLAVALSAPLLASVATSPAQAPSAAGRTEIVRLDVVVTDAQRRPGTEPRRRRLPGARGRQAAAHHELPADRARPRPRRRKPSE